MDGAGPSVFFQVEDDNVCQQGKQIEGGKSENGKVNLQNEVFGCR